MAIKQQVTDRISPCPLCGDKRAEAYLAMMDGAYLKCANCQLVSVDPIPAADQMVLRAEFWANEHHKLAEKVEVHYSDQFQKIAFSPYLQRFQQYFQLGRILDIGCGIGSFVFAAKKNGWDSYGVDVSSSVEVAKEKGLNVLQCNLEEAGFSDDYFDVVTLFDVIEHIPDPRTMVHNAVRVLRPGGCLFLLTPNLNSLSARVLRKGWEAYEPSDHLALYNASTLGRLLHEFNCLPVYTRMIDLNFMSFKRLFVKDREVTQRKAGQRQRRRLIKFLLRTPFLLSLRNLVNQGLTATGLGDKLLLESVKQQR